MTPEQLAQMSREEKLLYYDLLQEKKRRLKEKRDVFSPNEGQRPVLASKARERFVVAGNGGGKTGLAVNAALYALQGYNPHWQSFTKVPAKVIVVLDSPSKVAETWLPELQKWANIDIDNQCEKQGAPHYQRVNWANGSYLQFMFHDMQPMKFESIEADAIIFDEPPPKHIYTALKRGLRKKGTRPWILFVGTPIAGGWIRRDLYDPWKRGKRPDIEFFEFSTDVNKKNLAEGYLEWYFGNLSEKEQAIRRHGKFFDLDGLALAHLFSRETHCISAESLKWNFEVNPCVIAIDPHPSKKHYAILLGCDENDNLVVLSTFSAKKTGTNFMTALIDEARWFDFKIVDIVYDSLGNAESTGGEGFKPFGACINEVLKNRGLGTARATTYKEKSDEDFIERVRGSLTIYEGEDLPRLRFLAHLTDIIVEVENVQWAKHKNLDENKPKLDIENKDFISCLKYALATNLIFQKAARKRAYGLKKLPSSYVGDRHARVKRSARMKMQLSSRR